MDQRGPQGLPGSQSSPQAASRRRAPSAALADNQALGTQVQLAINDVFGRDVLRPEAANSIRDAVDWALSRRSVSGVELVDQPPPVFNHALDALRHCQLRKELIFLLASSLEKSRFHRVLPSHVEILRQLTPDEYLLISNMLVSARGTPVGTASITAPNADAIVVYRHVVAETLSRQIEHRENIPQYIDNLLRLGLIEIRREPAGPEAIYRAFTRMDFLLKILEKAPHRSGLSITPNAAHLTDLGKNLRALCSD